MTTRLELKVPTYLDIRTPRAFGVVTPPAAPLKTGMVGFIFYTWNQGAPSDHSIAAMTAVAHLRGYNWTQVWLQFFQGRGMTIGTAVSGDGFADPGTAHVWLYSLNSSAGFQVDEGAPNSTKYVQLRGMAIFHFFSAMRYAVSGHGWGAGHIALVKSLSRVNTKCGTGLFNFESISQSVQWNPRLEPVRLADRPYVFAASTTTLGETDRQPNLNGYGCSAMDKYEDSARYDPSAVVVTGGSGYSLGGVLTVLGGTGTVQTTLQVATRSGTAVATVTVLVQGVYTVHPTNPVSVSSLAGTGATFTMRSIGGHGTYPSGVVACPHTPAHAGLPAAPSVFSKHNWECGGSAAHIQDHAAALAGYDQTIPEVEDFKLHDNMLLNPYKAAARNNYDPTYDAASYQGSRNIRPLNRSGWKGMMQAMQEVYATKPPDYLWCNLYGVAIGGPYTSADIRNIFAEEFFLADGTSQMDTLTNLKAKILQVRDAGQVVWLNAQPGSGAGQWFSSAGPGTVYGTWAELLAYIDSIGARPNVFVMTGRDSAAMHWQAGFDDPNNP